MGYRKQQRVKCLSSFTGKVVTKTNNNNILCIKNNTNTKIQYKMLRGKLKNIKDKNHTEDA